MRITEAERARRMALSPNATTVGMLLDVVGTHCEGCPGREAGETTCGVCPIAARDIDRTMALASAAGESCLREAIGECE